jgi:N-glycosylase/DNA lyase
VSLSTQDVNGPLNLSETILSAQTSEPEWLRIEDTFTDVDRFGSIAVKYSLIQLGGVDDFTVKARVLSSNTDEDVVNLLRVHLDTVLGLKDDLRSFYRKFADRRDPLSETFPRLEGLRLMRGTNLYESLICSILSQNNSARLWNRTARLLMEYYGERVDFPDGSTSHLFPKPENIAPLTPRQLRAKTSMGYRARPVVQVSKLIAAGDLDLEEFRRLSYDEALKNLLMLPGVGPKVADCFLLYGIGRLEAAPVDVWIHRIVSKLYFRGKKVSKLKVARFLRERYEEWAGYAQLYLFDYARHVDIGAKRPNPFGA